jgi:hypothetical protein
MWNDLFEPSFFEPPRTPKDVFSPPRAPKGFEPYKEIEGIIKGIPDKVNS